MYHLTSWKLVEFNVTFQQWGYVSKTVIDNITFIEWGNSPEQAALKIQERIDKYEQEKNPTKIERIKRTVHGFIQSIIHR